MKNFYILVMEHIWLVYFNTHVFISEKPFPPLVFWENTARSDLSLLCVPAAARLDTLLLGHIWR